MKTIRIINRILSGLIIVTVFFFLVGITYSYFTSGLTGKEDTTTITMDAGYFEITYDGGPEIFASSIYPSTEPFAIKTFTVTGTNNTPTEMSYKLSLALVENTFSKSAISYTLESTNVSGNGEVVPSVTERKGIGTVGQQLGRGYFINEVSGAIHQYKLTIYFYETGENQSIDMRRTFKAYVKIDENYFIGDPLVNLNSKILEQGGGVSTIEEKPTPDFNVINGSSGLYAAEDEYGMSYYYRGLKDELNNNLIFGGFQWKIIRINGDGSIRIIYNGTCPDDTCTINSMGTSTLINDSTYAWNTTNNNDNKYVGYVYGGANGIASTIRNGTTSEAATYNENDSNAKTILENWYQNNILGKIAEDYIVDNIYCNDRQLQSEVGGYGTGTGYGTSSTNYAAYYRLNTTKTPTLKCGIKNDRLTFSDIMLGNGSLTYPIGLISGDESAMAGLRYNTSNSTNYLYTNQVYWTSSPYSYSSERAGVINVSNTGSLLHNSGIVTTSYGLRAVLNLDSETTVTGDGSATNPYKVVMN